MNQFAGRYRSGVGHHPVILLLTTILVAVLMLSVGLSLVGLSQDVSQLPSAQQHQIGLAKTYRGTSLFSVSEGIVKLEHAPGVPSIGVLGATTAADDDLGVSAVRSDDGLFAHIKAADTFFAAQNSEPDNYVGILTQRMAERATATQARVVLDVPLINQFPDYPTGCELASTTMLLQYFGANLTIHQVAASIPYAADGDPSTGFVGNPRLSTSSYNEQSGWTIYPEKLAEYIDARLDGSPLVVADAQVDTLKAHIRAGHPVILWLIDRQIGPHNVVLTGFDADGFYINDPYVSKNRYLDAAEFALSWNNYSNKALTFIPTKPSVDLYPRLVQQQ
ncbi:MAG: C39 family peptidase [Coriobacteriales bacterium]|jgi:uncharacterized protein YvpB|nr:C39 family peptidase [Coriobacteriales bacterium]